MKKLKTGCAYHGNRMLSHAIVDMKEIARADMDIVVHMFSHMDWDRHSKAIKEIFDISKDNGLEVWVDNWGLGGMPGDKSHFLSYHPEAHMQYGDGVMHPYQVCLNAPSYRQFVKDWLDKVAELGGKTAIWDEPQIPLPHVEGTTTNERYSCCSCPECKKLFREKYGKEMPLHIDAEVGEFRTDTIMDFFTFITDHAASLGMKNVVNPIPQIMEGFTDNDGRNKYQKFTIERLLSVPHIDNVGTDPYWYDMTKDHCAYDFVYGISKKLIAATDKAEKDHSIWIQGYNIPSGREEELFLGTAAAYDAGARTILSWSFHAGESNTYRCENPERAWAYTVDAFRSVKSMERAKIIEENRKKYRK